MRSVARLCLLFILSCLAVSTALTLPAAAQSKQRAVAASGPPAGGDALILWCRRAVFLKYGQTGVGFAGAKPGQKTYVMYDGVVDPMIDYCVQNKGARY